MQYENKLGQSIVSARYTMQGRHQAFVPNSCGLSQSESRGSGLPGDRLGDRDQVALARCMRRRGPSAAKAVAPQNPNYARGAVQRTKTPAYIQAAIATSTSHRPHRLRMQATLISSAIQCLSRPHVRDTQGGPVLTRQGMHGL